MHFEDIGTPLSLSELQALCLHNPAEHDNKENCAMSQPTLSDKGSAEFRLIASSGTQSATQFFVRVKGRERLDPIEDQSRFEDPPSHRFVLFAVEAGYFLDWSYNLDPCDPTTAEGRETRRAHLQTLERERLHIIHLLLSRECREQAKWIDWLEPGSWHYLEFGKSGAPAVVQTGSDRRGHHPTHYVSYLGPVTGAESWELTEAFSLQTIQAIA